MSLRRRQNYTTTLLPIITLVMLCYLCTSSRAFANDKLYGVAALGYLTNEIERDTDAMELNTATYKLSIGYEASKQWSFEAGYQSLGESLYRVDEIVNNNTNIELNSLFISALGKASNRYGELFYRIGVMHIDAQETSVGTVTGCENDVRLVAMHNELAICQRSGSIAAGNIGLGFDFYIHHSTLLRIEIEHIQGQDGYSGTSAYIGFRLNF
ncbi:MAG: outer membrane beta-barrel protein [Glaciecola sp.]